MPGGRGCRPLVLDKEYHMGDAKYTETSVSGQRKSHKVRRSDGGVFEMTQEQWRQRDKNAGLVRVDDDGNALPEEGEA